MSNTVRNLGAHGQPADLTPVTAASHPDTPAASGCCGGPAPAGTDSCCDLDAEAKATGGSGCGCSAPSGAAPGSECC